LARRVQCREGLPRPARGQAQVTETCGKGHVGDRTQAVAPRSPSVSEKEARGDPRESSLGWVRLDSLRTTPDSDLDVHWSVWPGSQLIFIRT